MPNFWPCKSLPKRNGHLDTSGVSTGGHSVAYEDPDAHLHHHPLVRHHNMEVNCAENKYSKMKYIVSLFTKWKSNESNYVNSCYRKVIEIDEALLLHHKRSKREKSNSVNEIITFQLNKQKKRQESERTMNQFMNGTWKEATKSGNEFVKILWFNVSTCTKTYTSTDIHGACYLNYNGWKWDVNWISRSWI